MIFLFYFPIGEKKKSSAELIKLFEIKLDFPLQKSVWRQVFQQQDTVQKKKKVSQSLNESDKGKKVFLLF